MGDFDDWAINLMVGKMGRERFTEVVLEVLQFHAQVERDREIIPQQLYLMSRGDGYYKVGVSIDPRTRVKQVQTGCNVKLKLEAVYDYDNAFLVEQFILGKFPDKVGEWIYLGDNGKKKLEALLDKYLT